MTHTTRCSCPGANCFKIDPVDPNCPAHGICDVQSGGGACGQPIYKDMTCKKHYQETPGDTTKLEEIADDYVGALRTYQHACMSSDEEEQKIYLKEAEKRKAKLLAFSNQQTVAVLEDLLGEMRNFRKAINLGEFGNVRYGKGIGRAQEMVNMKIAQLTEQAKE